MKRLMAAALGLTVAWMAAGAGPLAAAGGAAMAADTTFAPAVVALGDSIFHGQVAGAICFTCHGPAAKGTPGLAPDLTDAKWLHGDGSYAFIVKTVTAGVPKPKEAIAPMLPMGGAKLSPNQINAVAAYVYSLRNAK